MRMYRSVAAGILSVSVMTLGAAVSFGQDYPTRAIQINAGGAGGIEDFISRTLAERLTAAWDQPVIVENRSGFAKVTAVAQAPADGYTLLAEGGSFWIAPLLQDVPYDLERDFTVVSLISESPNILVVHESVPVNSVEELIALAKERPGELNYASGGNFGGSHMTTELFSIQADIDIVHVPYAGSAPAIASIVAGETDFFFVPSGTVQSFLASGQVRALGITSLEPSPLFPDLPPISETLPGFETSQIMGIFAPSGTPTSIIETLNEELERILQEPEIVERFTAATLVPIPSSPEDAHAKIQSEISKWSQLIEDAGIEAN